MNIVLLSGGSGKRLWPLSNHVRSKQFIKIFRKADGSYESMLQRMYRQILQADPGVSVTIAAPKEQVSVIHNQIGDGVPLCLEPCRRDTFPAVVLASAFLHDQQGVSAEDAVVFCPVDPYVEPEYFLTLKELGNLAAIGDESLVLLGIEPDYPSEKYGYIIPEGSGERVGVRMFKEKPGRKEAEGYIRQGALWNGGAFAFRLGYGLKKAQERIGFSDYETLSRKYGELEKTSFDYAVVEKEKSIQVVRFRGYWKDLGTWNTLTETMSEYVMGDAVLSSRCQNVHVVNSLDIPVLCMGLKNAVVAAGPDGILVSDKEESSYMKPYVEELDKQVRYAEKSWGSYHVLDAGVGSLTVKVTLNAGRRMNYHSHERRDEVWIVLSGKGSCGCGWGKTDCIYWRYS